MTFKHSVKHLIVYAVDGLINDVSFSYFRPGSVVVEFQLVFKTKVQDEEALAPLKKGVKDGKMGSVNVYPESLKIVKEDEGIV